MTNYNKLIRDKIPEIIAKNGSKAITHTATDEEYLATLYAKVLEELEEFKAKPSTEEMADIIEVLRALAQHKNIAWGSIEPIRQKKYEERGGFEKKIILDRTE